MWILLILIGLIIQGCGVASDTSSLSSGNGRQIIYNTLPLRELWRGTGAIAQGEPPKILIKKDVLILVAIEKDHNRVIYAFDIQNGDTIWKRQILGLESLDADDNSLYIGDVSTVVAYDLKTGEIIWDVNLSDPYRRGSFYVYSKEKDLEVYDFDVSDGYEDKRIYILDSQTGVIKNVIEWNGIFVCQDSICYSRTYNNGKPYLVAQDKSSKTILWKRLMDPQRWPIFINDTIYLKSSTIWALNKRTGEIQWESKKPNLEFDNETGEVPMDISNQLVSNIAYSNGLIFAINGEGSVVGFDYKTGQPAGKLKTQSDIPITNQPLTQNQLTIAASDKYVAAYYGDSQELIVFERTDVTP